MIAENDQSQWKDDTGVLYHFPKRYRHLLMPGTQVVYYKGRLLDAQYTSSRLAAAPHYFGIGSIGSVHADKDSAKGDLFATIENYQRFSQAVIAKSAAGQYLEQIPANKLKNYWRDGVRQIDASVYAAILANASLPVEKPTASTSASTRLDMDELESMQEGSATSRFVTRYERDPRYRRQALAIHGHRCAACDVDMGRRYGPYAAGLIHVHHVQPVSTYEEPRSINPETDLVPVCPNCHSVIHREKSKTLTVAELREMLQQAVKAVSLAEEEV